MIIIGIDPGLSRLGYGIINIQGQATTLLTCGVHQTKPATPMAERLHAHYQKLAKLLKEYTPEAIALEKIFVHINPSSALKLGYVRGLVYLLAGENGVSLFEYAAKEIKAGITGYGGADKTQVLQMVLREFPQARIKYDDESDALALALHHAHNQRFQRLVAQADQRH